MAEDLVSGERLEAGRRYLDALDTLGFVPDGAMWSVRRGEPDTLELSLFSRFVDRIGTGRMFEVLFEAHERARTPPEFDPWYVGLYSPRQALYEMAQDLTFETPGKAAMVIEGGTGTFLGDRFEGVEDFRIERIVESAWVYRPLSPRTDQSTDLSRRWKRFEQAVAKAA